MFVFFTCAFICRLGTYLLPGKPYSSKGPDSSAKKGRITTNPIWIIHVFSINMRANVTRVPSYHAIPTCILYYQERFMHFFSFLSKLALYHFYIQRQSSSAFIYAIQITISALAIWNICYSLVHDFIRKLWLINIRKKLICEYCRALEMLRYIVCM